MNFMPSCSHSADTESQSMPLPLTMSLGFRRLGREQALERVIAGYSA